MPTGWSPPAGRGRSRWCCRAPRRAQRGRWAATATRWRSACPHHPLALALLAAAGPLAVTSANHSGDAARRPRCDELTAAFADEVAVLPVPGRPADRDGLHRGRPRARPGPPCCAPARSIATGSARLLGSAGATARLAALAMTSFLVVCTGNVCRSPIAEGLLRNAMRARFGQSAPAVASAGTQGWEGHAAMPESVAAARERGVDIEDHVARALTPAMVEQATLVVTMAQEHADAIARYGPEARARTFTLKELVRILEHPARRAAGRVDRDAGSPPGRRGRGPQRRLSRATPWTRTSPTRSGLPLDSYRAVAWELDEWVARLDDGLFGAAPATLPRNGQEGLRHAHRDGQRPRGVPPEGGPEGVPQRARATRSSTSGPIPPSPSTTRRSVPPRRAPWPTAGRTGASSWAARARGSRSPPTRSTASARRCVTTCSWRSCRGCTTTRTSWGWGRVSWRPRTRAEIVRVWLETPFEGGRHVHRLEQITQIEEGESMREYAADWEALKATDPEVARGDRERARSASARACGSSRRRTTRARRSWRRSARP